MYKQYFFHYLGLILYSGVPSNFLTKLVCRDLKKVETTSLELQKSWTCSSLFIIYFNHNSIVQNFIKFIEHYQLHTKESSSNQMS